MKKIIALTLIIAASILFVQAQEKTDANKLIKERTEYLKANLKLNAAESKVFWSAYEQFLRSEVKYQEAYRTNLAKKGIKLNAPGQNKEVIAKLTDSQLTYLQDQKFELRKNMLNLETSFYKKIKGVLTPRHIQDFYNLDQKCKRCMVDKKKSCEKEVTQPGPINAGKKKR